jgi:hypothetical protein
MTTKLYSVYVCSTTKLYSMCVCVCVCVVQHYGIVQCVCVPWRLTNPSPILTQSHSVREVVCLCVCVCVMHDHKSLCVHESVYVCSTKKSYDVYMCAAQRNCTVCTCMCMCVCVRVYVLCFRARAKVGWCVGNNSL